MRKDFVRRGFQVLPPMPKVESPEDLARAAYWKEEGRRRREQEAKDAELDVKWKESRERKKARDEAYEKQRMIESEQWKEIASQEAWEARRARLMNGDKVEQAVPVKSFGTYSCLSLSTHKLYIYLYVTIPYLVDMIGFGGSVYVGQTNHDWSAFVCLLYLLMSCVD